MRLCVCIADVYHSVHMLFSGGYDEPWRADEPRECKMVFIGRNLDAKLLAARFNACLATPENMAAKAAGLRFEVGDRVECRMGRGAAAWTSGTVHALNYRDANMPPGMVAPYQILLDDDGGLIWSPKDCDSVIRVIAEEEEEEEEEEEDAEVLDAEEVMEDEEEESMRDILRAIGLEQYAEAFEDQDIEPDVMREFMRKRGRSAIDETLELLGVGSIGHRIKIANAFDDGVANPNVEEKPKANGKAKHDHDHPVSLD